LPLHTRSVREPTRDVQLGIAAFQLAAITQDHDVIWSMHKKKNSESVLSGQMIPMVYKPIAARKSQSVRVSSRQTPVTFETILDRILDGVPSQQSLT
jgi:hypothetical protein